MKKNSSSLKRLLDYALIYKKQYLYSILASLLMSIVGLLLPKLVQILMDEHFSAFINPETSALVKQEHFATVLKIIGIYFILIIIRDSLFLSYAYITQKTGSKIVYDMRRDIYDKILSLPMTYFDKNATGSVVTRVTNDTASVLELFSYVITNFFVSIVNLLGIAIIMFILSPKLAGLVMLVSPLIIVISIFFQKRLRKIYDRQRHLRSSLNTKLSENISGMSLIQSFNMQELFFKAFLRLNRKYSKEQTREIRLFSFYRPGMEIILTATISLLIWFGGGAQIRGLVSIGLLYAFTQYIQNFFFPIFQMVDLVNVLQSALSSADRIFQLMDEEEEDKFGQIKIDKKIFKGLIEFDHVYFKYNKDQDADWIIKDLSFTVRPGHFVAFVGATGVGKSTILSLLAGFYKPDRGQIRLDGLDISEYDIKDLRRNLGIVQQDVFLFKGTILSNISMNRPEISGRACIEAAKLVRADDFIEELPDKYHELVLERGQTLSAGQRQLLSFARTIAANPAVLILDEATANIDTKTEQFIQEAINNMARNRTMLVVAHRISTIADADHVIVMQHGRKAEEGSPDELIKNDGLFRVLYELQYKGDINV